MRLTLARYGGFAAGLRRKPQVVDTDTLPAESAAELTELFTAAKVCPRQEETGPGRACDAMSYTITVEDGGESTLLRGSDTNMSPAFAALLRCLDRCPEAK